MRKRELVLAVAALSAGLGAAGAGATVVYSNDFDAAPTVSLGATAVFAAGGGGIAGTQPAYSPTYGNIFRNGSTGNPAGMTQLTLSNLPTHTSASIGFILGFLDSWDSRDGSCCTPDNVNLYIDGVLTASYTYNNALGSIKDFGAGTLLYEYVQFDTGSTYYSDSVVDMTGDPLLAFAHAGSSLTIGLQASGIGWQGGSDEAWGIDNLRVDLGGVILPDPPSGQVPVPATLPLLALGLGFFTLSRRRPRVRE